MLFLKLEIQNLINLLHTYQSQIHKSKNILHKY